MTKVIIKILIILVAILMSITLLSFVSGSLEMFPTAEQEDKANIITISIFVKLCIIETLLVVLYRKLFK